METIFLVLSGVILIGGVLYWFWSHIQLTQKKVQLLENAVFELRGLVSGGSRDQEGGGGDSGSGSSSDSGSGSSQAPVYQDLADDEEEDWTASLPATAATAAAAASSSSSVEIGSTSLASLQEENDLQPGGRLEVPSPSVEETAPKVVNTDDQFRELFVQREPRTPASPLAASTAVAGDDSVTAVTAPPPAPTSESLESMPVKDLRRLAEQRGITGVSEMRKKEILSALRQQITSLPPSAASGAGGEKATVVVERTLDLTQMEEGIEEATVLE